MLMRLQLLVSILAILLVAIAGDEINNLKELYDSIEAGPNRKVGFLSMGNYQVVRNTLPSNVEPVIVPSVSQLSALIQNDTLLAGLVTQVPPSGFNQFSSGILSPQTMFVSKNESTLLQGALNAAIVRVIESGAAFTIARNNPPFVVTEANSCAADGDFYPFPAAELLVNEPWYQRGSIYVASLGGVNWGNTGNYLVDPPTGFWPEYYDAISAQLVAAYSGSHANFTGLSRVYYPSSTAALNAIAGGHVEASDAYFVVDGSYKNLGRSMSFTFSCFAMASGSNYFTKRVQGSNQPVLSDGAYAGISIGGVLLASGAVFLTYLIVQERRGRPLFTPLRDVDDDDSSFSSQGKKSQAYQQNHTKTIENQTRGEIQLVSASENSFL